MLWWERFLAALRGVQREFRLSQWLGHPDDISRFKEADSQYANLVADEIKRRITRPGDLGEKSRLEEP